MKKLVLIAGIMLVSLITWAQGDLIFNENTHDFGEVAEEDGPVTYRFSFVNNGDQPVKINTVRASCGCTTPGWTKEEVAPQDSGFITARYNVNNRPGRFKKSLKISYNNGSGAKSKVLYIEGSVKPRPKTIAEKLQTKVGDIRLQYRSLNMGKATTEKIITKSFDVFNDGDSALFWQAEKSDLPEHILVSFEPETLPSKGLGKLIVSYDPKKKNDLGFVTDDIKLYTSEREDPEKELSVLATLEEYFPPMSEEELAEAPKLSFNETVFDFGVVNAGSIVETTFELSNTGKGKLLIRKAKANCSCTTAEISKNKIKPGQSIQMKVQFDTSGRIGRQFKTVSVFSNDPSAPSQMVTIKAEIKNN